VLNDAYQCDAPIKFPPQLLALGCLVYASVMEQQGQQQPEQPWQKLGQQSEQPPPQQQQQQQQQQQGQGPLLAYQQQQQQQGGLQGSVEGGRYDSTDAMEEDIGLQAAVPFTTWLRGLEVDFAMVGVLVGKVM